MFERHSWPARPNLTSPEGEPYEETHFRFRSYHSFRRARFGRRFPKLLHDALVRAKIDGSLRLLLGTGSHACAHFLIGVSAVPGWRGGRDTRTLSFRPVEGKLVSL